MNAFKVTKDGVYLDDLLIQACSEYNVHVNSEGKPPEVTLRIACDRVDIVGETGC